MQTASGIEKNKLYIALHRVSFRVSSVLIFHHCFIGIITTLQVSKITCLGAGKRKVKVGGGGWEISAVLSIIKIYFLKYVFMEIQDMDR